MRAALRSSTCAALLLSLLWAGAAAAQGPTMDEVESARGSAVEAFVTDRARGDWRAELPSSCGSTAKTDLSALICELRFREAQFAHPSWSASAIPGGVTNDDCARVSMLEEIRAAQRSMQGAMSDQEVQALLAQPFDIESIEAMGPDNLPLGARFVIFPTRSQIELAAEEPAASAARCRLGSAENMRTLVRAAVFLNGYFGAVNTETLRPRLSRLRAVADNWQWFLDRGRSQLPWEVAFNDWVGPDMDTIYSLPKYQWVLMHPSPVFEINDGDNADWALAIEPIGMVWYGWDKANGVRNRYYGISAVVSLADEGDPGIGAVFNYNGLLFGLNYRDDGREGSGSEWSLMLSMDLWRAFTGKSPAANGQAAFITGGPD